jgi:hypothetical protein
VFPKFVCYTKPNKFQKELSMTLPQDPTILYSYINTLLRDQYSNFEALCDDMAITPDSLLEQMSQSGYQYDRERNQFVPF